MCSCHVNVVGTLKFVMSQADRAIHRILAQQIRRAKACNSCNDSALGNQIDERFPSSNTVVVVIVVIVSQVIIVRTVTLGNRS